VPRIVTGVIILYILIFIYCFSALGFLFTNGGHQALIIYFLPFGIVSLAIAWGFFRRKIIYFKLAKVFNFAILVILIFLFVEEIIYGQKLDYFIVFLVIVFGIVQVIFYTEKFKKWFSLGAKD
jgi:hypothetical protein